MPSYLGNGQGPPLQLADYLAQDPNQVGPTRPKRTRRKPVEPIAIEKPVELLWYCEGLLTRLMRAPIEGAERDRICRELNGILEPYRLPKAA